MTQKPLRLAVPLPSRDPMTLDQRIKALLQHVHDIHGRVVGLQLAARDFAEVAADSRLMLPLEGPLAMSYCGIPTACGTWTGVWYR